SQPEGGSRDPAEGVFAGQLFVTSFAWRCASGSPGHTSRFVDRDDPARRYGRRLETCESPLAVRCSHCSPVGVKGGAHKDTPPLSRWRRSVRFPATDTRALECERRDPTWVREREIERRLTAL